MNYNEAINTLDNRKIGTEYNSKLDITFFFTVVAEVGEVRLLVEDENNQLVEEFETNGLQDSMEVVRKYCASPMYVSLEDLNEVCEPPYGDDEEPEHVSFYEQDKKEDDISRYNDIQYATGESVM